VAFDVAETVGLYLESSEPTRWYPSWCPRRLLWGSPLRLRSFFACRFSDPRPYQQGQSSLISAATVSADIAVEAEGTPSSDEA